MTDWAEDDIDLPPPPDDWAEQLLHFWFAEHGFDQWFGGGPDFDRIVTMRFADWREALRGLPASEFLADPHSALAAVILRSILRLRLIVRCPNAHGNRSAFRQRNSNCLLHSNMVIFG